MCHLNLHAGCLWLERKLYNQAVLETFHCLIQPKSNIENRSYFGKVELYVGYLGPELGQIRCSVNTLAASWQSYVRKTQKYPHSSCSNFLLQKKMAASNHLSIKVCLYHFHLNLATNSTYTPEDLRIIFPSLYIFSHPRWLLISSLYTRSSSVLSTWSALVADLATTLSDLIYSSFLHFLVS